MALELLLSSLPSFTIFFSPDPKPSPHLHRTPSELRFSRWNNANAQPFIRNQRAIKEIEDEIRRERRFDAANTIAQNYKPTTTTKTRTATNDNFKSIGTPSSPSRPSIPGKKSKYSKPPKPDSPPYHPAFRRIHKAAPKLPVSEETGSASASGSVRIKVGKDGVSYRIPNAPFEFQYSYTETPKLKPLGFREAPYAPFGPSTMPRPWTGRAPLQKKKLPEFDSFKLPPPHKKGVKPVQAPGPFLAGMGPKHAKSREEILGDPLTDEEKRALIQGVMKSRKQMNMGRDGLTHNMLDNIHDHWKRQRVCKIKCKGVCTVDMDNVRKQLEEKTGGKVIYTRGGLLFLYRGRNYNYRYRPRFPLMLWKPVTPVYPRLIKQPPEGLTMEEARMMCKRGRELPAICKLGKNGVYLDLVRHVREAFEECELVRVDCQGLNGSDYRRIGAKLQDLVPCVLITFQNESILMWRGRDWKSSLLKLDDNSMEVNTSVTEGIPVSPPNNADSLEDEEKSDLFVQKSSYEDTSLEMPPYTCSALPNESLPSLDSDDVNLERTRVSESEVKSFAAAPVSSSTTDNYVASSTSDSIDSNDHQPVTMADVPVVDRSATTVKNFQGPVKDLECASAAPAQLHGLAPPSGIITSDKIQDSSEGLRSRTKHVQANSICMEGVMLLRKQAIESGSAVILDDEILDASIVYERAVALAKVAPVGPVFMHGPRKVKVQEFLKKHNGELEVKEVASVEEKKLVKRNSRSSYKLKDFKEVDPDRVPHGTLGIDELSKLLV